MIRDIVNMQVNNVVSEIDVTPVDTTALNPGKVRPFTSGLVGEGERVELCDNLPGKAEHLSRKTSEFPLYFRRFLSMLKRRNGGRGKKRLEVFLWKLSLCQ